jgi:hypothetical protein
MTIHKRIPLQQSTSFATKPVHRSHAVIHKLREGNCDLHFIVNESIATAFVLEMAAPNVSN